MTKHAEALAELNVGDHVLVERKCPSDSDGWDNVWIPDMDEAIGQICEITRLCGSSGVELSTSPSLWFPAHCLTRLDRGEPKPKPADFALRDGGWYVARNGAIVQVRKRMSTFLVYTFVDDSGKTYTENGVFSTSARSEYDLIRAATADEVRLHVRDAATFAHIQTITQEKSTMSSSNPPIKVEQCTFVNGRNIADLNDDTLFAYIEQAERDLERLNAIKNKPTALAQRIADIEAGIKALVDASNARNVRIDPVDRAA